MVAAQVMHQFFDPNIYYDNDEILYTRNYQTNVL